MEQIAIVYTRDKIKIECHKLPFYAWFVMELWTRLASKWDFCTYRTDRTILMFVDRRTRSYELCTYTWDETEKLKDWLGWD